MPYRYVSFDVVAFVLGDTRIGFCSGRLILFRLCVLVLACPEHFVPTHLPSQPFYLGDRSIDSVETSDLRIQQFSAMGSLLWFAGVCGAVDSR